MVVTTFCTWLPYNNFSKNAIFTMDFAVNYPWKMVPAHKCQMEAMYKKLWPHFLGPSIGPIEGVLCHLCGTPRKIIIFTGQLCVYKYGFFALKPMGSTVPAHRQITELCEGGGVNQKRVQFSKFGASKSYIEMVEAYHF